MNRYGRIALYTYLLNLTDCFSIIYLVKNNLAEEANPLMNYLINHYGFIGFFMYKLIIPAGLIYLLYCCTKNYPLAQLGLKLVFIAYLVLTILHLFGAIFYV